MAGLTGLLPGNTYGQLLYIGASNVGLDATLRAVSSGLGVASPLYLSTTKGKWQTGTNSTDNFQFLDQAGTGIILNIDSTNARVGIGTATPSTIFQITDNAKYIKFSHGGGEGVIDAESSLWLLASGSLSMLLSTLEVRCYRNFKPSNNDGVSLGISSSGWSDLYLGGQANSVISQIRHTTANTAGNDLTINAGGATSGATDKNGGDTYITSGIATGSGSSNIYFQTATAGAAGTADRSPTTKMLLTGEGALHILETTTPTAIANYGAIYAKTDNKLYFQDGAGTEHEIAFV
jgi:hypothetical protein